jgi:hypothetical protein
MYIYSENITSRLTYIVETLLGKRISGLKLTSSLEEFYNYEGLKINYSYKKFSDNEFHIIPHGLLAKKEIRKQHVACFDWNGLKAFFPTNGDIPFDIFSSSFFLMSRYEEYLPHQKDSYGRFAHIESLAFKEGFLNLPLVNLWLEELIKLLKAKFPQLKAKELSFTFIPTYDIDIAYNYTGKGFLRNTASWIKSVFEKEKLKKTGANGKDIFDVYDWLDELHQQHNLKPVYFFLLAKHRSRYDKNLSPKSAALQVLIRNTSGKYQVGIHPSWQSYFDERMVKQELQALKKISGKEISISRQHYIQITLPITFRKLITAGIADEYSMGYGSINGFRASYCLPFYWYDLMKEEQTSLTLHSFCYMEANSFFEQKLNVEQAREELQRYFNVVKKVNGQFITIFHNHFLTEEDDWLPWRSMYCEFLRSISLIK